MNKRDYSIFGFLVTVLLLLSVTSYADDFENKEMLKIEGYHNLSVSNYQKAEEYGRRLLELGEQTGDRDYAELYGRIIVGAAIVDNDPDESFRQLEIAHTIAHNTGNREAMLSINNMRGIYYMFVHNDAYTASTYYYKALEDARAINDERKYGIILSNLSGVYLTMKDASGCELAEQSLEMALKLRDPIMSYYAKHTLAQFYLLTDRLDDLENLIDEIESEFKDGKFGLKPDLLLQKAGLAEKRGDINQAYIYYARAMEDFEDADASKVSATYLAYAELLRKDKRTSSAIDVLELGLTYINKQNGWKIYSSDLIKELVYCYQDSGNYKKALEYAQIYRSYNDSIYIISRERALQENRIRHEVYVNERIIDEQKMQLMSSRMTIAVLAVSILAALSILGVTLYNYRKKDRLYLAIVRQNKEYISREQILMEQVDKLKRPHESSSATRTPLPTEIAEDIVSRFTQIMLEQKLFKDPSITIGTIAEKLDTNRTYLSRAINESTGKTFIQIINEYRIREAIALITDSNLPLKQICFDVGYNSLSTFYTTFQSVTGMTPARYRTHVKNI